MGTSIVANLSNDDALLQDDYGHGRSSTTKRRKKRSSTSHTERPMATKKKAKPLIKASHKGLLHKDLGVPSGQKIGKAKLEAAKQSSDPAVRKRANFAINFNDNGTHGVVTAVRAHHNGKHVNVDISHGRKKSANGMNGYDDRPTSSIMVPKSQASRFPVGQRVGVGAVPLSGANTDEMPDGDEGAMPTPAPAKKSFPPKKSASAKKKAPRGPSQIARAMGANC